MTRNDYSSRRCLTAITLAFSGAGLLGLGSAPALATTSTLSFPAEVDTWVSAAEPDSSFGTSSTVSVDGSPQKQAFLRFDIQGVAGRPVVGARLRMRQTDSSDHGGRVFTSPTADWPEAITWNTRPSIGPQVGSFGPAGPNIYYEADLEGPTWANGKVTLAVDSPSSDGAKWSSREAARAKASHAKAPRLILEVESGASVTDGFSEIAGATVGSSSPTYYASQHRLALTEGRRLLTVHGLHATGVQLAWRDAAGTWQNQTTGQVPEGILLRDTGTGDWPASIAVARDSTGEEHAWVVFARASTTNVSPVYIRRLSDLDSPAGPSVGPLVEVDTPPLGAFKPDLAFEPAPTGGMRGAVLWSRRSGDTEYQTVAGWLTDLDAAAPVVHTSAVIDTGSGAKRHGTLVRTAGGLHALVRPGTSPLVLFTHSPADALTQWRRGPGGMAVSTSGHPSAVGLSSGEILGVAESDVVNHIVKVQRFSAAGSPRAAELTLSGYAAPSIASDGQYAWVVMVRQSDGAIVSRQYAPGSGWSVSDRVEIAGTPGSYAHPNLIREADGRLRFVLEGPGSSSVTSQVLAFQRGL